MTDDDFESRRTIRRVIRVIRRRSKAVIPVSIAALVTATLLGIAIPWLFFRSGADAAPTPPRPPIATCAKPNVAPVAAAKPPPARVDDAKPRITKPTPPPVRRAARQTKRRKPVVVMLVDPFQ